MSKKHSMKDDVEGWIVSGASDRLADYAARGRKHQGLTHEDLTTGWLHAFRRMADDVRDPERRAIEEDFKSELLLRKSEPPYNMVREEFERFIAETDRAIQDRLFQMRVSDDFLKSIDKWRAKQEGEPSRAEAVRRLVELGLKVRK